MKFPRPRSLTTRLASIFFVITAVSIGVVYFYVVPQLESSLIEDKVRSLETVVASASLPLSEVIGKGESEPEIDRLTSSVAQRVEARVTILGVLGRPIRDERPQFFVISDSQNIRAATDSSYAPVADAIEERLAAATGVDDIAGVRMAMAVKPLRYASGTPWVAVYSRPLKEVTDNVRIIQTQILLAGAIGLLIALVAGYFAARSIAKRVRRLQDAARLVAAGKFGNPIEVDSDDELGDMARTFNEMQRKLARLDTARKEFIATASHELRTPLFSLSGFVELLEDEDIDEETKREFLGTMGEQVQRLTKLATDLLDLSRLDSDALELNLEDTDLTEVATSVAQEFGPVAQHHASLISVEIPANGEIEAYCDSERVAQIVRILISNAIIHTPVGTDVAVRVASSNGENSIEVVDNGPGIDPEEIEHVFERFHSADSSHGTGLGLAIAQELAERMEGSLRVSSQPGETVFTLTIPQSPSP